MSRVAARDGGYERPRERQRCARSTALFRLMSGAALPRLAHPGSPSARSSHRPKAVILMDAMIVEPAARAAVRHV